MPYLAIKHLHVGVAILSLLAYTLRGIWMIRQSPLAEARWVRIVPHIAYTALVLLGATLATLGGQWGFAWIWLKLALLVVFAAVGAFAFSPRSPLAPARRMSVWGMGLVLFLMIFAVAAHHHALMSAGVPPEAMQPPPGGAAAPGVQPAAPSQDH